MRDLISRLQDDGVTLWRPDVKETVLGTSTGRRKVFLNIGVGEYLTQFYISDSGVVRNRIT